MDPAQRLTFGSYRQGYFDAHGAFVCLEEGLIHDDELVTRDPEGFACLQVYAETHLPATTSLRNPALLLWSRRDFLNHRLWDAIRGGTLIVGYNLAFDLTRLGTHAAPARGEMFDGGFSVTLYDYDAGGGQRRPNPHRPWLRIKPIDSKRTLMGFASRMERVKGKQRSARPGPPPRLLDLRHLVFALTDRKLSLEDAAAAFGLPDTKLPEVEHGRITERYIDYNRQDVALAVRVLERVRAEFDRHPLGLLPDWVMSPASIAKGYLRAMGVEAPLAKYAIPPEVHGAAMGAYYGGRTEVRVRRVPVPVVYLDFRSMYPTVNTLMRMWDLITAERIDVVRDCAGVRTFLARLTRDHLGSPALWPDLRFFALVKPAGDILPVRAQYDRNNPGTSIGVNPVRSYVPIWVAGPDLVASWLLTGRVPEILDAIRLVPRGKQEGLRAVALRGQIPIDPAKEDFFKRVIELRQETRARPDLPTEERDRLERLLKVLANSGSYGIFAELNAKPQSSDPIPVTLYGVEGGHPTTTHAIEEPGEFWFPPFAALTTSAARLMLALLEQRVTDVGGTIAFGDTDSAAIVATRRGGLIPCPGGAERMSHGVRAIRALSWAQVQAVIDAFVPLNPYDRDLVPDSILRMEQQNFDQAGRQRTLWAFAISAKRYALFTRGRKGKIEIVAAKEHGLGHLLSPLDAGREGREWIPALWEAIVREALGESLVLPAWVDRPAVSRITVSTTTLWRPYEAWNEGKPYGDQVKPMNFGLSLSVAVGGHPGGADPSRFHLIGVYERDPARWLAMEFYDRYSQAMYRVGVGRRTPGDRVQVNSIRDVVMAYRVHAEPKSLGPDGEACGRRTIGLLRRRPVRVASIVYIGKESNALEQVEQGLIHALEEVQPRLPAPASSAWDLIVRPALLHMELDYLASVAGTTERHVRFLRDGQRRPSLDVEQALQREALRWAREIVRRKLIDPDVRRLAEALIQWAGRVAA
jgi:hypothetical protein